VISGLGRGMRPSTSIGERTALCARRPSRQETTFLCSVGVIVLCAKCCVSAEAIEGDLGKLSHSTCPSRGVCSKRRIAIGRTEQRTKLWRVDLSRQ